MLNFHTISVSLHVFVFLRKYLEYLYAAADDQAFDRSHRSVFTWKDFHNLRDEGLWLIAQGNVQGTWVDRKLNTKKYNKIVLASYTPKLSLETPIIYFKPQKEWTF